VSDGFARDEAGRPLWRTHGTRTVFEHPRMTLVEDDVELPNGLRVGYLRVARPEGAFAVAVLARRDGMVLLEREYSHPPGRWLLQLPGGGGNPDEPPAEAANRELMEEAGLRAGRLTHLGAFYGDNRRSDARMHVFLAEELVEERRPADAEETIESVWVAEAELDRMIAAGEVENVHRLAAWCLYRAKRHPPDA